MVITVIRVGLPRMGSVERPPCVVVATVPCMDFPERWDDETIQDAVDVLQDLVLWEMSPQRWEHIAGVLQRIDSALAGRDPAELREAVTELEISGPARMLRIGTKQTTGIPPQVLERRNALVHSLTSGRRPEAATRMVPENDCSGRQTR